MGNPAICTREKKFQLASITKKQLDHWAILRYPGVLGRGAPAGCRLALLLQLCVCVCVFIGAGAFCLLLFWGGCFSAVPLEESWRLALKPCGQAGYQRAQGILRAVIVLWLARNQTYLYRQHTPSLRFDNLALFIRTIKKGEKNKLKAYFGNRN